MNRTLFGIVMAVVLLSPTLVRGADDDEKGAPKLKIQVVTEGTRPGLLSPLYVSLAGLQVYDGYSTLRGVNRGARETNALVGGLAAKPAAFWAVKAGSTAFSILMAERLWRTHHRGEAVLLMIVTNG